MSSAQAYGSDPEWARCGQCYQFLFRGHHPVGSTCEHATEPQLLEGQTPARELTA